MRTIRFASAFAATPSCARPIAPGDAEHLGAPLEALTFLDERHIRQLREIKARTYANLFGLVERIVALAQAQSATSQAPATAGMHRLGEALAEQQMFRHFERMAAASQAEGYAFEPEALLAATRNKSPWALFAFIYCIELFVLATHKKSIDADHRLSAVCKVVFLDHWREQSKHATLTEAQWLEEDARVSQAQRALAVSELAQLWQAMDALLRNQAALDADYFLKMTGVTLSKSEVERLRASAMEEYRRPYAECASNGPFAETFARLVHRAPAPHMSAALPALVA